jgi:hypothetical protein
MNKMRDHASWLTANSFWRDMTYPDHVVEIYDSDQDFLDSLLAFAEAGFSSNESVVVIATGDHLRQLEAKLHNKGHDLFALRLTDQYIALDASKALYEFVIGGSPDAILFRLLASNLMKRAKRSSRKVRAFGEMVAILWAQGNKEGTLCLEQLWSEYMQGEPFSLFCAYPRSCFSGEDALKSINEVCKSHSHQISLSSEKGTLQVRKTTQVHP